MGAGRLDPLWAPGMFRADTAPTAADPCPGQPDVNSIPFALGSPQTTVNSSGQLTNVAQSIGIGYEAAQYPLQITSPHQCWQFLNDGTVASYGSIDINGVWLEPESGNPELLVESRNGDSTGDGTVIEADGSDTTYGVWVPNDSTDEQNTLGGGPIHSLPAPEATAPLILIGQVNLGSDSGTPFVYDGDGAVFGSIGPSSSSAAITYSGAAMTGGHDCRRRVVEYRHGDARGQRPAAEDLHHRS
jgi:hypothetical protein